MCIESCTTSVDARAEWDAALKIHRSTIIEDGK